MISRRGFLASSAAFLGSAVLAKAAKALPFVVNGAGQTGSTLEVVGCSGLKRGDIFTIAGVYQVNPLSYAATDHLQRFVVTEDVTAARRTVMPISPFIITAGQLQTVTNPPADGAVITRNDQALPKYPWASYDRDEWNHITGAWSPARSKVAM